MTLQNLGAHLRGFRAVLNLTREEAVAKLLTLTPPVTLSTSSLAGIEAGTTDPKISVVWALLTAYGVSYDASWALVMNVSRGYPFPEP